MLATLPAPGAACDVRSGRGGQRAPGSAAGAPWCAGGRL